MKIHRSKTEEIQGPDVAGSIQVRMLPPCHAVYMEGAVLAPVFVQREDLRREIPPRVYVPPLLLASNITRIIWNLVLLRKSTTDEEIQFVHPWISSRQEIPQGPEGGEHLLWLLSPNQVCLDVSLKSPGRAALKHDYDLHFRLLINEGPLDFKAKVKADPTVGVSTDPVDIPTWP